MSCISEAAQAWFGMTMDCNAKHGRVLPLALCRRG